MWIYSVFPHPSMSRSENAASRTPHLHRPCQTHMHPTCSLCPSRKPADMHNDGLDALKLHLSSLCVIVSQRTAAMCTPSADTAVQSEPRQYHLELRGGAANVGHHRSVAGPQRIHYSPGERQAVLTRHERPIGATIRATASGRPASKTGGQR